MKDGGIRGTEITLYSNGINNDGKGPGGRRGPHQDHREGLIDNPIAYVIAVDAPHISHNIAKPSKQLMGKISMIYQ